MAQVKAPFTREQVDKLVEWQASGHFHPFTCGMCEKPKPLVPCKEGWFCMMCDYRQDWAHDFMFKDIDWTKVWTLSHKGAKDG